jgi:two-component system NtrC family sensor kinase
MNKVTPYFLYVVLILSFTPFLLNLAGFDFGSATKNIDLNEAHSWSKEQQFDGFFHQLRGAFTHTLLEWTAFVYLAYNHYLNSGDLTTAVIGIALFLAGCMDAFHTLAADRLINAVADNRDLIPFTWAICRIFNAVILIFGISLLLLRPQNALVPPDLSNHFDI